MLHCEDQNQILGFQNKQGGNASNIYLCRAASPGQHHLPVWFWSVHLALKTTTKKQADEVRKVVMNELL